jgi:Predicted signal transduction protein with a C-terminal ATPase domain
MKKKALSERVKYIMTGSLLLFGINIFVLAFLVQRRILPEKPVLYIVIVESIFLLVLVLLWRRFVYYPYKELEKLCQQFIDEQIYEELFENEGILFPEWEGVMQKLRHLFNKQDAIRMSKKQAEYLALQNQINPHFLYNTLEAIRGDAICAGIESIAETTEALSIFFRYSITGVDRLVTLEEEIDNVENYFTIQYYRFGEKLKFKMTYPEDEDIFQLKIPKLTIQPFVENAIFHGIEKKVDRGMIEVKIETTKQKVMVTISDDGVGMEDAVVEELNSYLSRAAVNYVGEFSKKRGGIAMKNVNSRIKLLFGEKYGIQVYSTKNIGTDVKVILPKIRRGEYEEGKTEN